ncbi:hypothetical protein B0H19DRAFT_1057013 [Mycena capillaripes]|nr:hypothetical protein B0H19DRAFT_1057013 [Mycena capillaripes]
MANGQQRAGSSRGGAGSAVGHTPNDGAPVFGGGYASRGQRELGIRPTSRGPQGEEQRPAATETSVAVSDKLTVSEREAKHASCAVSAYLAVSERLARCEATE